ncbi:LptE family protein [bacterium]|nr:LptE family protein [bacterium]
MKTCNKIVLIFFCITLFFRCGIYSFSGSTLPPHIKTVAIPLFKDQSSEFGIDQQVTDGIISAITKDNSLKIAGERQADALINGTIIRITDTADSYNSNETASDFKITIQIKVTFEDVKKRNIMWEETFSQWGRYDSIEISRDQAITDAAEKLAAQILNRTVSGW